MVRPSFWPLASARHSPALAAAALLAFALPSCSSTESDTTRKCYEQVPAISPASDGRACGVRAPVSVNLCERLPATRCSSTTPTRVCVSTPGDRGFIVELSPCGELESLPEGWSLASTYTAGVNAEKECFVAQNLCDGTSVNIGGSAGSSGSSGASGSSGSSGSGGSPGTSGSSGSGGSPGTSGSSGSAGAAAGSGGGSGGSGGASGGASGGSGASGAAGKAGG